MAKATSENPSTLVVQLVVRDDVGTSEQKYAQRCMEQRKLFRELFATVTGRELKDAGPLASHEPSIAVLDADDQAIIVSWGGRFKSLIHSVSSFEGTVKLDDEISPKKKKPKSGGKVFIPSDSEDDDERMAASAIDDEE